MEKNQKQIMKVLKDMGYTPEIDADGDICIYLEMKHFYFFVAETEDTKYVNLVLPQFAPIEEGQEVLALATRHLAQPFEAAFEDVFGGTPPDELNHDVHLIVVAGEPEAHLDRIARYLRPFGVPLSVVFLSSFEDDGRRYLTRSWLGDDDEPTEPGRVGKRAP